MNLKKLVPWNWFSNEEELSGSAVPVQHTGRTGPGKEFYGPFDRLYREMDQLFDNFFSVPGYSRPRSESLFPRALNDGIFRPSLDISTDKGEYTINIEIPGVEEKDIKLELVNNILTVSGEKREEKEEKEKGFYRKECSYGSFQRVLTIPEDADQDGVKAGFKNGVLTISMPKKALPGPAAKRIEIQ